MELFMKKILYLLFFLSLNSFCASDTGLDELQRLTDEDLPKLGILNLPPDPAILSGLPYNSGMDKKFHQLNTLQEEDFAALGLLDSAAYTVTPSDLQRAVSIDNAPQDQAAWTDLQNFPVAASSQNSHFLPDVFKSGEQSVPGPIRRPPLTRRNTRRVLIEEASSGEEEIAEEQTESDYDYSKRRVGSIKVRENYNQKYTNVKFAKKDLAGALIGINIIEECILGS